MPLLIVRARPGRSTTSALGDSISAGWMLGGIRETPDLTAYEYRGSSWAAGGDNGEVTVPIVRPSAVGENSLCRSCCR